MYHYRESGLRNVWLANGYDEHDTPYGRGIAIHNVEGLHRAIGRNLVTKAGRLTGPEVRFLRTELGMSQAKLASLLGNDAQSVAGWEKKGRTPKWADRLLRALYREQTEGNVSLLEIIERLADTDLEDGAEQLTLQEQDGDWRLAA
jgi:putative transcriptional regulator